VVAVYRLPGGVAAAGGGLQPLLVAVLSVPLANRRPTAGKVAVGLMAALGVALVVVRPGADIDPLGAAAVAANVSLAAGVVLTKRWPSPSRRLAATGWQLLVGGALLVPLAAAVEGGAPTLAATNLAALAYLTLVATAAAFLVWFSGIERLPAPAPLLGLAAPVTGAVLDWLLLGQSLSPIQLVGFAITLATIACAVVGGRADTLASDPDGPLLSRNVLSADGGWFWASQHRSTDRGDDRWADGDEEEVEDTDPAQRYQQ
jgi:probable blue pigment (indigoidine) exporter